MWSVGQVQMEEGDGVDCVGVCGVSDGIIEVQC